MKSCSEFILEGRILTVADQRAAHDKTMKQIVKKVKDHFKAHLVDGDCSVSFEPHDTNHKISYLTLVHHDLMDLGQEKADTSDLVSIAQSHDRVKHVERIHNPGNQPSFFDYRKGAMPSVTVAVHHE